MKILLFILCFFAFLTVSSQTITYLKVADKPEYEKYLAYCNTPVPRTFYIKGAVTLLKVGNNYHQANGDWTAKLPLSIKWFPVGTTPMTFEQSQQEITAKVEIMLPKRYPASVDDFYKNWKTGNILQGLTDSKTCGVWPDIK